MQANELPVDTAMGPLGATRIRPLRDKRTHGDFIPPTAYSFPRERSRERDGGPPASAPSTSLEFECASLAQSAFHRQVESHMPTCAHPRCKAALTRPFSRTSVDWIEDDDPCDAVIVGVMASPIDALAAPQPDLEQCRKCEKLLVRIDRLPCISIAAIDGPCRRFWLQLALACDHRLATTRSTFQAREVKEGYLPGMSIFRLAKYVGIGVARRLLFVGEPLAAYDAVSFGLVDEVCDSSNFESTCEHFISRLLPIDPVSVQLARRLLNESFSTAFENFLGQYLASQHRCLSTRVRGSGPPTEGAEPNLPSALKVG